MVYLWVDGSDPVWLAKKRAYTGEMVDGSETDSKARYESNDELRYSLRSAEMYAPWIRRIFIVTDGQTPAWLDTSDPRVQIVDHREILPPESLPCYNSSVLNHYIYKIPGLSEYFLSASDDTFFGAPVAPDFFFLADGSPIVRLKRKRFGKLRWPIKKLLRIGVGAYRTSIHTSALLVERETGRFIGGIPHHNIDACRRSDYRNAVENVFRGEVEAVREHHTRAPGDLLRVTFSFYAIVTARAQLRWVTNRESLRIPVHKHDYMARLKRFRPSLFCLNDSQRSSDDDRRRIKPFLESLFPVPSTLEKKSK